MVLLDQLFNVSQNEHATPGDPGKLSNHQALTGTRGQDDGGGLIAMPEKLHDVFDRSFLIVPKPVFHSARMLPQKPATYYLPTASLESSFLRLSEY